MNYGRLTSRMVENHSNHVGVYLLLSQALRSSFDENVQSNHWSEGGSWTSSLYQCRAACKLRGKRWSDNISSGAPYRRITFSTSALATVVASWLVIGIASTYFEKLSTTVRMYKYPCLLLGCGPVRSMEIRSNGSPLGTGCRGPCLGGCPRQYWRHSVHCWQKRFTSPDQPTQ